MKSTACRKEHYRRIFFYSTVTFLVAGTISTIFSGESWTVTYLNAFVYTFTCSLFCTILMCNLINRISKYPAWLFYLSFILLVIAGITAGFMTGSLILEQTIMWRNDTLIYSLVVGIISSIVITSYMILRGRLEDKVLKIKQVEIENERLKRYELEARLNSLQAKLNPHFFFNTLNSTAALIYDNPHQAEENIVRLSDLYRKVFAFSDHKVISLSEELQLIEDVLELEKLRFEDHLSYEIICADAIQRIKIPGLLIEPLIENIIKHGYSQTHPHVHVKVRIAVEEGQLAIHVADDGPGFDVQKTDMGFGLYSIQERIRLLFGDHGSFHIESAPGSGTRITLRIPLAPDQQDDHAPE